MRAWLKQLRRVAALLARCCRAVYEGVGGKLN